MDLRHRRAISFMAALAAGLVLALASTALAKCKTSDGGFVLDLVPPPTCTSPVGVCMLATLDGDLAGMYYFVMDTLSCGAVDPDNCEYTGHDLITTVRGATLFGQDIGVLSFIPGVDSPFVTTVEIVGGTRRYHSASGQFVASGAVDFSIGEGFGQYTATICKGGDKN